MSRGYSQKHHDPRYEAVTGPFKDIEKGRKKGGANNYAKSPAFQHVCKVEGKGGLIKPVPLLKDKSLIQAKRHGWKGGSE
jgi:hypothetical protein